MPTDRMNRDEFLAKLATLDDERLRKALWNLYWRGSSTVRQRIEAELDGDSGGRRPASVPEPVDPSHVLAEVEEFVALARAGAYLGRDRRVSPNERTRWRFTFRRLAAEVRGALRADDVVPGARAIEALIDLACETRDFDLFRSEDPMEAARFVVSDEVGVLWRMVRERLGFAAFCERATAQLLRWESPYGWTRTGWGRVSEQEVSLASVLAGMLPASDMWVRAAGCYLDALDRGGDDAEPKRPRWRSSEAARGRTADLAEWHGLLLDRLVDTDGEHLLDRLVGHRGLSGPELTFLRARLAQRRGDTGAAQELARECLQKLPGHRDFLAFASEVGARGPQRSS